MSSISWWDNVIKDGLNMVKVVDSKSFFSFFAPIFFWLVGKNNNKGTLNFN